jgi:hypothetical protein
MKTNTLWHISSSLRASVLRVSAFASKTRE